MIFGKKCDATQELVSAVVVKNSMFKVSSNWKFVVVIIINIYR